jgi:hypothetical protein
VLRNAYFVKVFFTSSKTVFANGRTGSRRLLFGYIRTASRPPVALLSLSDVCVMLHSILLLSQRAFAASQAIFPVLGLRKRFRSFIPLAKWPTLLAISSSISPHHHNPCNGNSVSFSSLRTLVHLTSLLGTFTNAKNSLISITTLKTTK